MTSFNLLCTVAHNCHGKTKNLTAKTKYLTAKSKTSRQKQNTSRQNQNPHGKTKTLTAKPNTSQQKPNTSRQKQIPTAKPKLFCFCCEVLVLPWGFWFCREVFGFAVRYFVFAVRFLVLPWGFRFCRDVFGFAVTFLVLPWQLWATIGFAMNNPAQHCITWLSKCSAQKLDVTRNLQPIKFHIQISPLIKTSPVVHLAAAQHKCVAWHKHSSYSVYKKAFDKQFSKFVWNSWSWQRVWRTVVLNQIAKFETK